MKNIFDKYLSWSDKINKPFYEHKDRLALYVILGQSLLVTLALFQISNKDKFTLVCKADFYNAQLVCKER